MSWTRSAIARSEQRSPGATGTPTPPIGHASIGFADSLDGRLAFRRRLCVERAKRSVLLRHPKLLFQFLHQLLESLRGNRVGGFRSHALGLRQPPFKLFSVALFGHGDTLLHPIRRSFGLMVQVMGAVSV
jgi:hypothetical protein